jgi:copper chaperone
MIEAAFHVPEMSCGHCKAAIEGELYKLSGVEYSNANLEEGTVKVFYDEGRVSEEQLKGAIEDAGYAVTASTPSSLEGVSRTNGQ